MAAERPDDALASVGKLHGSWQRCGFGQIRHQGISTPRKRSYKRAIRRAQTHGYTWYRGHLFTAEGTCSPDTAHGAQNNACNTLNTTSKNDTPSTQRHQRFTLLSWNAGGLSQANWDNLQQWLCQNPVDVVFLQETRWRTSNEWISQHFVCVHSAATPSKSGGLLVLISRRLIAQHLISWKDVLPGRILWVRLHFSQRSVDLVNCYQHVWQTDRLDQREEFLMQLGGVLSMIPRRNMLYVAGDLNTSMSLVSDVIGSLYNTAKALHKTTQTHTDWRKLHDLLQIHGMVALNTFDASLGGTYIYQEMHECINAVIPPTSSTSPTKQLKLKVREVLQQAIFSVPQTQLISLQNGGNKHTKICSRDVTIPSTSMASQPRIANRMELGHHCFYPQGSLRLPQSASIERGCAEALLKVRQSSAIASSWRIDGLTNKILCNKTWNTTRFFC